MDAVPDAPGATRASIDHIDRVMRGPNRGTIVKLLFERSFLRVVYPLRLPVDPKGRFPVSVRDLVGPAAGLQRRQPGSCYEPQLFIMIQSSCKSLTGFY